MRRLWTVLAALATFEPDQCGYNAIQTNDEQVKSSWSEVVNQYQRRADLVPNLVNSVKGFAQQEKDVLLGSPMPAPSRQRPGDAEVLNDPPRCRIPGSARRTLQRTVEIAGRHRNYPQLNRMRCSAT